MAVLIFSIIIFSIVVASAAVAVRIAGKYMEDLDNGTG